MDEKLVNKHWQRALTKEQARASHHPKAPKGHRWEVTTRDRNLEPSSGRTRERLLP